MHRPCTCIIIIRGWHTKPQSRIHYYVYTCLRRHGPAGTVMGPTCLQLSTKNWIVLPIRLCERRHPPASRSEHRHPPASRGERCQPPVSRGENRHPTRSRCARRHPTSQPWWAPSSNQPAVASNVIQPASRGEQRHPTSQPWWVPWSNQLAVASNVIQPASRGERRHPTSQPWWAPSSNQPAVVYQVYGDLICRYGSIVMNLVLYIDVLSHSLLSKLVNKIIFENNLLISNDHSLCNMLIT